MPNWWEFPITQGYGPTNEPLDSGYNGYAHFNKGLDYGTPLGTPITALVGGRVVSAGPSNDGWGTSVKIIDAQGNTHNYGHLSGVSVKPGDTIQPGTLVGQSGNTGASTGPHLSYDVWTSKGDYIDPTQFVSGGPPMPVPRQTPDPQYSSTATASANVGTPAAQAAGGFDEFGFPVAAAPAPAAPAAAPTSAPAAAPTNAPAAASDRIDLPGGGYMQFVPAVGDYAIFMPRTDTITGRSTVEFVGWNAAAKNSATNPQYGHTTAGGNLITYDSQGNIINTAALPQTTTPAVTKPDGFIEYDEMGRPFVWQGGKLVPAPQGTPPKAGSTASPQAAAKKSPSEQAASTLVNTQQILKGNQPSDGAQEAGSAQPQSPLVNSVPSNYANPSTLMGGGQSYYSQPREIRGPTSALGQAGELVGVELPYEGGSRQYHIGTARQDIMAAGMLPTGDASKDMQTALGIQALRTNMLAMPGATPLSVQDYFDTSNLGKDVYGRAKALGAMNEAVRRPEAVPAFGTDRVTASMLSDYITPQREEEGVNVNQALGYATGTEEQQPIVAGAQTLGSLPTDLRSTMTTALTTMGRNAPYEAPVYQSQPEAPAVSSMPTNGSSAGDFSARGYGPPRYYADGTMSRGQGDNAVVAPMTGGRWQGIWQSQVPSWEDYLQYFWDGNVSTVNQPLARRLYGDIIRSYGQEHGLWNNGPEFQGFTPQNMRDSQGRSYNLQSGGYGSMGGSNNFFGRGSFAEGTSSPIMAGTGMGGTMYPPDTAAPGRPGFTTPEPLAMIGMNSGRMMGMAGEAGPEAISVQPLTPPAPPQASPEVLRMFLQNTRRPVKMGVTAA